MRGAATAAVLLVVGGAAPARSQVTATASTEADAVHEKAEALISAGRAAEAETAYRDYFARHPKSVSACSRVAEVLLRPLWGSRSRFDEAMAVFESCLPLDEGPSSADRQQAAAALFWDKAYRDGALTDEQKVRYADRGLVHVDRALQVRPNLLDAVVYKGLLLRVKAATTADPGRRQALLEEAGQLQKQAVELKQSGRAERSVAVVPLPPPPPPPPRPPLATGGVRPSAATGVVRVGGAIKEPQKLKHVNPAYPDVAKQARVQGVVIMECTIDPQGKVSDVQVLRGIPLLDEAAMEAVRQWEYTPTLLDGVAVPVIMTVTVNFRLQ